MILLIFGVMGFWQKDIVTGEFKYYQYACVDNGEDPCKNGWPIHNEWNKRRTKQRLFTTDDNGQVREIKLIVIGKMN